MRHPTGLGPRRSRLLRRRSPLVRAWRRATRWFRWWRCPACGAAAGNGIRFCDGFLLDPEDGGDTRHPPVYRPFKNTCAHAVRLAIRYARTRGAVKRTRGAVK